MSNIDDTTTGTGPAQVEYLNDDALDFRTKNDTDRQQESIATNPRKFDVLISIEAVSITEIARALSDISNKISGGIDAGTKKDKGVKYTYRKMYIKG